MDRDDRQADLPLQSDANAMKAQADKSTWKGDNATVTKEFVTKTAKDQ
ncbi:hypothetical protein QC334_31140 [Streptomyces sp. DH18]|nr:hypothetical protein [Streptomyces sp. DH18]MDG9687134.1 hypothetical protein [Streptomyces sp. DH18]